MAPPSSTAEAAREGDNIFPALLATVQSCSLGQISRALYEVVYNVRKGITSWIAAANKVKKVDLP